MTDFAAARPRLLLGAAASLTVLAVLTVLVVTSWQPLQRLDTWVGTPPEQWTYDSPLLRHAALGVAAGFTTAPVAVLSVLVAVALRVRRHPRAALWVVGVMVGAWATTFALKRLVGRPRPHWADPVQTLSDPSFPSGHATVSAAAMGVATVLTLMFVRRRVLQRWLLGGWLLVVLVVGADRILLGVHHLSDVVAGWAVGATWVLLGIAVFSPAPRSLRRRSAQSLPEVFPSQRRLAVVLNPAKVEDVAAFQATVTRQAHASGWSTPTWYATTIEDPGAGWAEDAAIAGADMVLVCGGDGTVRTVCAELAGTGIPVGIVPTGTGNLLARNLALPLYLPAAIDVALNGQDRAIDLVAVSGDGVEEDAHYLVMAGMGFDAAIMEGVNEGVKARVGWIAYVFSALRSLMFPAVRLEISVDDAPWVRTRARTIVIGNVGYLQAGMPLLPDATLDDGLLDVVILHPRRFLSWIPLALRVLSKRRRTDATLQRMTGAKVAVRASSDTPRQLDGDSIGPGKELVAECQPGKLLVRAPR